MTASSIQSSSQGSTSAASPQPQPGDSLFVPVTSERFVAKAHTRGADAIILDLEDSILPAHKAAARAALPAAVPRVAQGGADVVVRINRPIDLAVADIATSVMPGVAALMLPKVMGPEHVRLLAELVAEREAALGMPIGHTRFLALIESPAALPHLFAIAPRRRWPDVGVAARLRRPSSAPFPRPTACTSSPCRAWRRPARRASFHGVDGTAREQDDLDLSRGAAARQGAGSYDGLASTGARAIINEEYGASAAELDRARRLIAAFEAAAADGRRRGLRGSMIDLPVVSPGTALLSAPRRGRGPGNGSPTAVTSRRAKVCGPPPTPGRLARRSCGRTLIL